MVFTISFFLLFSRLLFIIIRGFCLPADIFVHYLSARRRLSFTCFPLVWLAVFELFQFWCLDGRPLYFVFGVLCLVHLVVPHFLIHLLTDSLLNIALINFVKRTFLYLRLMFYHDISIFMFCLLCLLFKFFMHWSVQLFSFISKVVIVLNRCHMTASDNAENIYNPLSLTLPR